jgi:hypothetical protein
MKKLFLLLLATFAIRDVANAQTSSSAFTPTQDANYQIVQRDANSQIWERTVYEQDRDGHAIAKEHRYTELATGLNYWDPTTSQWTPSKEEIKVLPDGTAAATNGQHQVYFPANIYNGEIRMVMSDGKILRSQPLALSYDNGSNTVLIAVLTNSIGELLSSNQVIYPNAFVGITADLLYTYTRAGFEQDIIIREQPPAPETFNLNSENTRLQMLTEFFNPPQVSTTAQMLPDQVGMTLNDDDLDFGTMKMGRGRAFLMGTDAHNSGAWVGKKWVNISGRQILVEEVPVMALANDLLQLPRSAKANLSSPLYLTSARRLLPEGHLAEKGDKAKFIARATMPDKGVILDYQTINTGTYAGYSFRADNTYYISGNVTFAFIEVLFEGGAVIKYAQNASIAMSSCGQVVFSSGPYQPVIFTAKDDNSVGEPISGSTGKPSGYYANAALSFGGTLTNATGGAPTINNFRIAYASQAITIGAVSGINFDDGQIVNCLNGVLASAGSFWNIRNVLFSDVPTNFNSIFSDPLIVQNSTFKNSSCVVSIGLPFQAVSLHFTNCIFANVASVTNGSQPLGGMLLSGNDNGFYNSPEFGAGIVTNTFYPLQTAGAGDCYLTNTCAFLNAGTANLDAVLVTDLQTRTVYAPNTNSYAQVTISTATTISTNVARDNSPSPSLGYHYAPIDYIVDELTVTNTTLTVTNGAILADYNEPGIQIENGGAIVSEGTVTAPNWFVRYSTVQDATNVMGGTNISSAMSICATNGMANGTFQFSKFSVPTGCGYHFYDDASSIFSNLIVQDCELYDGQNDFSGTNFTSSVILQNNLFQRSSIYASNTFASASLAISNNLFWGTTATISQPPTGVWNAFNNDFDSTIITNSTLTNGYNAYLNCVGRLNPTNATDIFSGASLAYQPSFLGNFYQPPNSPLIQAGSTTADQVGLYHFTTQTNQSPETNAIVDIGYHYVATDQYGNPLDNNNDGIPDYVADANGNGLDDASEVPWNVPLTNLVIWLKADKGVTANGSGNVSAWADQSGNGNNASQSSSGNQPLLVSSEINGLPALEFNGSQNMSLPNCLTPLSQAEVFAVIEATNWPTSTFASQTLWELGYVHNYSDEKYPFYDGSIQESFGSMGLYALGIPAQPLTQFHIFEVSGQTGPWSAWINGILLGQYNNNTVGFWSSPDIGNPFGTSFSGYISEIMIFNKSLTASERSAVNGYLNWKYGLVPIAPTGASNLVATAISTNQVSLTWNDSLNGGSTQISVERSTSGTTGFSPVAKVGNTLSYIDTNLTAGTTYYYRVRAINFNTWSPYSNTNNATTFTNGTAMPLASLLMWLKADSGVGQIGTNAPVDLWADQSGNNNNAIQTTGSSEPSWIPGVLNGLPIIRFNGSSDYLQLANCLTSLTQAEVFAVVKAFPGGTASQSLWFLGSSGNVFDTQYPANGANIKDNFGSLFSYNLGVPPQPLTQYNIYEVSVQNTNADAWLNQILLYQVNNNTHGFSSSPILSGNSNAGSGTFFYGDVAEVLIFNRALTPGERATVNLYLNGKYGLVSAVPPAPTNLMANAISQTQIGLTWSESLTNAGATGISIERSTNSSSGFAVVAQVPNTLSYIDTNLTPGTKYYYQVRAINVNAWSAYSNQTNATTLTEGTNMPLGALFVWLKGDAGLAQGNTNMPVDLWADQSGNGNNAQQVSGSEQPIWLTNALNNLPAIQFNGGSDFLQLANGLTSLTQAEAFAVVQALPGGPSSQSLWFLGDSGNAFDENYPASGAITENFGSITPYNLGTPAQPLTQFSLYQLSAQSTNWTAWIDGMLLFQTSGNYIGFNTVAFSSSPILSGDSNAGGTTFFKGNIAEILIFDRALTADERNAVSRYLLNKYSLAQYATNSSLPTTPTNFITTGIAPYQLNLQWMPTSTNAYSFILEREVGMSGFQQIGVVSYPTSNFVDTTASPTNTYYYRVKAHNLFGDSGFSTVISPPTVSITNWPATIIQNAANSISAQAADAYGTISSVNFLADTGFIATATTAPYTVNWPAPLEGPWALSALATDSLGNSQYSDPLAITVYLVSNTNAVPNINYVQVGNNPLNPWLPPPVDTNDHTAPIITLLVPTNAVLVP